MLNWAASSPPLSTVACASSQASKYSESSVLRTEIARCKVEQIELNVWARGIAEENVAVALTWTASARRLGMVSAVGPVRRAGLLREPTRHLDSRVARAACSPPPPSTAGCASHHASRCNDPSVARAKTAARARHVALAVSPSLSFGTTDAHWINNLERIFGVYGTTFT